jgi:hypothetical protein
MTIGGVVKIYPFPKMEKWRDEEICMRGGLREVFDEPYGCPADLIDHQPDWKVVGAGGEIYSFRKSKKKTFQHSLLLE